jgi:hypothetical protein
VGYQEWHDGRKDSKQASQDAEQWRRKEVIIFIHFYHLSALSSLDDVQFIL